MPEQVPGAGPGEYGPFNTDREASGTAAVRAVYAAFEADPGAGKMRPHNTAMLTAACEAAGVELGDYDARTLAWLGTWEPHTCAVIAGIIRRAARHPEGTVTEWGVRVTSLSGYHVDYPAGDEVSAREQAASHPRAGVVRREVTPWTPVPGEGEDNA